MSQKLAIRGHSTRGKEVIEILEMMGGKNIHKYDVIRDDYVYFLSEKGSILAIPHCNIHLFDCVIFTLEEFLEKYPFKVGDKVFLYDNITEGCVTGMKWDEGTVKYCVYTSAECWCDVKELLKWNAEFFQLVYHLIMREYIVSKQKAKAINDLDKYCI